MNMVIARICSTCVKHMLLICASFLLFACDPINEEPLVEARSVESTVIVLPAGDVETSAGKSSKTVEESATNEGEDKAQYTKRMGPMIVPLSAVFADRQGGPRQFVWVINEQAGTVHQREVEIGRMQKLGAEILRGLKEGERIVTADVQQLNEGDKVELLFKKG